MSALTLMCCPSYTLIKMVDLPVLSDFLSQTEQRDEKRPATLLHLLLLLEHSTCLWRSSSPSSHLLTRPEKQKTWQELLQFLRKMHFIFFMCISCTFCLRIKYPQMLLRGCALVFSSQSSVNRTLVLLPPKRESGLLRKALRYRLCFSFLVNFLVLPCCISPVPPSLYVVGNVVWMFIFEMKRYNFRLDWFLSAQHRYPSSSRSVQVQGNRPPNCTQTAMVRQQYGFITL